MTIIQQAKSSLNTLKRSSLKATLVLTMKLPRRARLRKKKNFLAQVVLTSKLQVSLTHLDTVLGYQVICYPYSRTFSLDGMIDPCTAEYSTGVLRVIIPLDSLENLQSSQ